MLGVHSDGTVSAEQVKRAIREDTCLVTVMFPWFECETRTNQPAGKPVEGLPTGFFFVDVDIKATLSASAKIPF